MATSVDFRTNYWLMILGLNSAWINENFSSIVIYHSKFLTLVYYLLSSYTTLISGQIK